ncbi:MAG: ATP-binding protein [Leptospirales bacterium]|nr:ATP-binding protein [Leptospirales bacterium]
MGDMVVEEKWNSVLAELAREIPGPLFRTFIEPVRIKRTDDLIELHVQDERKLRHITSNYLGSIERAWKSQVSAGRIRLLLAEKQAAPEASSLQQEQSRDAGNMDSRVAHRTPFFPHSRNLEAVSNLLDLRFPARIIFLRGGVSSGKTHLLRSLESQARARNLPVEYTTLESFITEFALACKTKTTASFRTNLKSKKLLLIDDLQFIKSGARQTQEELRHLVEHCISRGNTIVFAADRSHSTLPLREDLASRFAGAFSLEILAPDQSARLEIARSQAAELSIPFDAAVEQLAIRLTDVRRLKSALMARAAGQPADLAILPTDPLEVVEKTSQVLGIPAGHILGSGREKRTSMARHLAMYICHSHLNLSLLQIATTFGRKHHTAVIYAIDRARQQLDQDLFYSQQLESIVSALRLR